MSPLAVARNDLRGAVASRGVRLYVAGLTLGLAAVGELVRRVGDPSFGAFLEVTAVVAPLLFPLVGVVLGYRAVVAARQSGTLVLSLSLPNSRASFAAGAFLARATIVAASFGIAGAVAGPYLAFILEGFDLGRFVGFLLLLTAYTLSFTGLATGLSLGVSTTRRAVSAAFGAYLLLVMLWRTVVDVAALLLFRFRGNPTMEPPTWLEFARFVSPEALLRSLGATALDVGTAPPPAVVGTEWFVDAGVAAALLVGWTLVPLLLGFLRFSRSEV